MVSHAAVSKGFGGGSGGQGAGWTQARWLLCNGSGAICCGEGVNKGMIGTEQCLT